VFDFTRVFGGKDGYTGWTGLILFGELAVNPLRGIDSSLKRSIVPTRGVEVERVRMSKSFPAWRTKNADQSVPSSSN
jgi:hypothetical protein